MIFGNLFSPSIIVDVMPDIFSFSSIAEHCNEID